MTKRKLLFIYGPLNAGGAERVLLDYLQNLDRSKYELELCLIVNGGTLLHEVPKDITIFSLFPNYNLYYKLAYRLSIWIGNDVFFKRIIQKKITKQYDVIISFLEGMPLKVHTLIKSTAKNITWVHADLDLHRYSQSNFYNKNELAAYAQMDKIVMVSQNIELSFLKRFSTLRQKTTSICNPIDFVKIEALALSDQDVFFEGFSIVLVGRLTYPKRIDRLILLAQQFLDCKVPVKFYVVGDGELRYELESLAKEKKVASTVTFLGYQSNPYPFIKNADILVSTSSYEGFGLVLCEAMALGVPVVSTRTAGALEIVGENEFGLLCDHTIESLYDAVKMLLEDESLRQHYIKMGFERVKDFSIDKALHLFNQLVVEN
jgi:glycosyltransferase involved in cell wall biosynthesis